MPDNNTLLATQIQGVQADQLITRVLVIEKIQPDIVRPVTRIIQTKTISIRLRIKIKNRRRCKVIINLETAVDIIIRLRVQTVILRNCLAR